MAKLLLNKSRNLNFFLTLIASFFLVVTGWGQTEPVATSPIMQAYTAAGLPNPTVTSDKDDYSPGMTAVITGSGWTLDEYVDIHLEEDPAHDHHHGYHDTKVNADGTWTINYPIEERHLGVTFTVIVDGKQTKYQATTIFTDAGITNVRITANNLNVTSLCMGQNIEVIFDGVSAENSSGQSDNFPGNNVFIAQLSGATGSFSSPTDIGTLSSRRGNNQIINATIPLNIASGSAYRIRVISNPATNPSVNGTEITISALTTIANAGPDQSDISAASITLAANAPTTGTGAWSIISGIGGSFGTSATSTSYNPTATFNGTAGSSYILRWAITNGACTSADDVTITFSNIVVTTTTAGSATAVYSDASVSLSASVSPADATGSIEFFVNGTSIGSSTVTSGTATMIYSLSGVNANSYIIKANFTGTGTYASGSSDPSRNGTLTVDKAATTTVVTFSTGPFTYTGSAITPATVRVTSAGGLNITPDAAYSNNTNAGTATASASYFYAGDANHEPSSDNQTFTINKADANVSVAGTTVPYNGAAHGASGTAVGVNGEELAGLDLGASFTNVPGGTASWTFTDATGNYNNQSGTAAIVIDKADATVSVSGTTVTYNGAAHGASGTAVGVNGEELAGLDLGASFTNVPGGTASWTFTDATGNYNNQSGTAAIVIGKADATVSVSGTTVTYNGAAHGASGTAVGVNGEELAGLDLGASFTNVPGGTASWTFTDATGNYNNQSGTAAIVIGKANATVSVAGTTVTYNGAAHGASGSAVGVNGETLSGLDLGASFTNVSGGTASWTFTDATGNYNNQNGTAAIVIGKADATVSVAGTTVTYNGAAHGASGTAVGVNGEELAGLDLGASFTNVPGGTASWTFTDATGNYNNQSGTAAIVIGKADATVSVAGTTVTYNGAAHGASGTAVGVNGEELAGLDLGASFTNVPGGTAFWTFTDATGNYNNQSGTAAIVIGKADATVSVAGTTVTYNGAAHGASGTAVGVNGEELAGLDLGASFTNVPGGTASWTFTDATGNYNNQSGTAAIVIGKADATVSVAGTTVTYNGAAHGASGTAVGVNGEELAGLDLGASFTNVPGGTASWTFTDATGNYNDKSGSVKIVINKAPLTITAPNLSKYCGQIDPKGACDVCAEGLIKNESVTITYAVENGVVVPAIGIANSSGFDPANYTVIPVNGVLTVKPVTFDITDAQTPRPTGSSSTTSFTVKVVVKDGENKISDVDVKLTIGGVTYHNPTGTLGTYTFTIPGLLPGLYEVFSTAGGSCSRSETVFLPIYDPNGGFVTGGGWIESPAGASKLFPDAVGRANFGFNAKYKTGKNNTSEVDGHTNFQFKAGDLHFSSLLHHNLSLVVSGAKATYTGEGTINGLGSYEFRLIALDGDLIGTTDKFRIKIWTKGAPGDVIYDNEKGVTESADASTAISGGSIVIHKPKAGGTKQAETTEKTSTTTIAIAQEPVTVDILGSLAVAPNPVKTEAKVRFSLIEDASVSLRLFDFNGREIQNLYSGSTNANQVYEVGFLRNNLMSGVYIVKLTTDRGNSYSKQVIIE